MNLRRCVLNRSAAEGAETALRALSPIHTWTALDRGVRKVDNWDGGDAVGGEKGSLQ